jgi:phage-related protein
LWDGISNAASGLKEKVSGIASGIKDSFTGFFQIRSPSRVMMEVGGHIIGGLNDGMSAMQGQSQDIAESIGSTIGNAFKGVIDGSKSVKDALKEVLSSIASMLANNAIKSLFGGIGGGGGGFLGSLFGGLMGFANGGSFQVGGAGGVDSQLVAFKASPNERVSVTKPGQSDGMGTGGVSRIEVFVSPTGEFDARVANTAQAVAVKVVGSYDKSGPARLARDNGQARARGYK